MKKLAMAVALAAASGLANASYTYVGSFNVYDGPAWGDNPPVYSALEAAALIFGGSPSDYAVSVFSDSVTHTAWYDGWGDHDGHVLPEGFKVDLGAPGYNDPGGWVAEYTLPDGTLAGATAFSAYVQDGLSKTNYVFAVPEPETYAMFAAGLGILGAVVRRRRAAAS